MQIALWNSKDFWAGAMFASIGVATIVVARRYAAGTAAQMGPGYFPAVLGAILACLGLLIAARAALRRSEPEGVGPISLRQILLVLASVAGFGLLLEPLGLILTSFIVMMTAARASHQFRLLPAAINATAVTAMSWAVFSFGLKLTMPVWPRFVAG